MVRRHDTILLVEDEEALLDLARDVLHAEGYLVLEARHPGEALLIAERHRGAIHLLLTDVVMPHMSGFELAGRMRALRPDIKVLYMSGYPGNVIGLLETSPAEPPLLQKPFTIDGLLETVRVALESGA